MAESISSKVMDNILWVSPSCSPHFVPRSNNDGSGRQRSGALLVALESASKRYRSIRAEKFGTVGSTFGFLSLPRRKSCLLLLVKDCSEVGTLEDRHATSLQREDF
ncbi:hypothetical protein EC9_05330 [Rosistilla ulvae]|uniref:Uncharacterized protein n=1 Tax=Rosistilla ulvae TaxID=1930277 RepID=A0A517LUS8_9BACT|nr:hypothetical protein EC9_05330 [Rosistilla ulvae]